MNSKIDDWKNKKLVGVGDLPVIIPGGKYDVYDLPPHIKKMESLQFDIENPPEDMDPIFTYISKTKIKSTNSNIVPLAYTGDIVGICGHSGMGKSSVMSAILSSAFIEDRNYTFGFDLNLNENELLVHNDTEQGEVSCYNWGKRFTETVNGVGSKSKIERLKSYPLSWASTEHQLECIDYQVHKYGEDIGVLAIDLITDLVDDINSQTEVKKIMSQINTWKNMAKCLPIVSIHFRRNDSQNPKPNGTAGTALEQKAKVLLAIENEIPKFLAEKNKYIYSPQVTLMKRRGGSIDDVPVIKFHHDDDGIPCLRRR